MTHDQFELLLPEYIRGTLSWLNRWRVSRHLKHCTDCQEALEDHQALRMSAKAWANDIPQPSDELRLRALDRRENLQPAPRPHLAWWVTPWVTTGLLIPLCIIPWLKLEELNVPQDVRILALSRSRAADAARAPLSKGQHFVDFEIDINAIDEATGEVIEFSEFRFGLRSELGDEPFETWTVPGHRSKLNLRLPAQSLDSGRTWMLHLGGRREDGTLMEIGVYQFVVER